MASKKSTIIEFEFDGEKYEADSAVKGSYLFAVGMASAETDFNAFVNAMNMLFPAGRHIKYVRKLGDDMTRFSELAKTAIEAIGAKN